MLHYGEYSKRLAKFFAVSPQSGETIAVDGKVLRGSYQVASEHSTLEPHPAIMLVNAYIVERGLIFDQYEVDRKTNAHQSLTRIHPTDGSQGGGVCI